MRVISGFCYETYHQHLLFAKPVGSGVTQRFDFYSGLLLDLTGGSYLGCLTWLHIAAYKVGIAGGNIILVKQKYFSTAVVNECYHTRGEKRKPRFSAYPAPGYIFVIAQVTLRKGCPAVGAESEPHVGAGGCHASAKAAQEAVSSEVYSLTGSSPLRAPRALSASASSSSSPG